MEIMVIGTHLDSDAYPNVRYRLRDLRTSKQLRISEINVPMWSSKTQNRHGFSRLTRNVCRTLFAHAAVALRYLALMISRRPQLVYVPYPAVFMLFFFSWLPAWLRPSRIVADVFISLYDTIVNDRNLLKKNGLPARLLKKIETRAYAVADAVIVDTPQNVRYLCAEFALPASKVIAIPLSTDEIHFRHIDYIPRPDICRVLFVGTLVPLHGIESILGAATLLHHREDIQFELIGDGQDAHIVESWLKTHRLHLRWERQWQSSEHIAEKIAAADICLGIFGAGDKTQRVCPFKIYAYAAVGRAIITGETNWLKEHPQQTSNAHTWISWKPFASVAVNDPAALASKITELANDSAQRLSLATGSRKFYEACLSNEIALKALKELMGCL